MIPHEPADTMQDAAASSPLRRERRVRVLLTGGTLGMRRDPATGSLRPVRGHLAKALDALLRDPETGARRASFPAVVVEEFPDPMDSSDMGPPEWRRIAEDVFDFYDAFDGFVVVMGTDTMAYAGSALAFMLDGLGKPLVLTGAMLPLEHELTDAQRNLFLSIQIASLGLFPEVVVCFNDVVLRACRCKKVAAERLNAFESPNLPPLAVIGTELVVQNSLVLPHPTKPLELFPEMNRDVLALKLLPGLGLDALGALLAATPPLKAVVLELYGSGNAPQRVVVDAVRRATALGVLVVVLSQCHRGWVDLGAYRNGRLLLEAGVVSGGDMTLEACVVKLAHLLGRGLPRDRVAALVATNMRGELTRELPLEARFSPSLPVRSVL